MKPALVLIGLGNPGSGYARTHHNIGFLALEEIHRAFGTESWKDMPRLRSRGAWCRILTSPILLLQPQTFMNRSGEAVEKVLNVHHLDPKDQILILYDDIDLPLGTLRLRLRGSAGTHRGLQSIVESIGEEFPRLRIGIGPLPPSQDLDAYVLSRPSQEEENTLQSVLKKVPDVLQSLVLDGEEAAQRRIAEITAQEGKR